MPPDDKVSELVCWCFEPSQPQRITSGLNTNFSLSPAYSFHKSLYHKSSLFFSLSQTTAQILFTISERKTRKANTCFGACFTSPRALNTAACIQQGDLFYSAGRVGEEEFNVYFVCLYPNPCVSPYTCAFFSVYCVTFCELGKCADRLHLLFLNYWVCIPRPIK